MSFPGTVEYPPGELYPPDVTPPSPLQVLFIGVAPPEKGRHFYTDPSDKLRAGLFRTLPTRIKSIPDFLDHRFFLLHTAKCSIRGTTSPDLCVSRFCAARFLAREIACLRPAAICALSANIGHPVLVALSLHWNLDRPLSLGRISRAKIAGEPSIIMATKYPTRGWEGDTRRDLAELFRVLEGA